MNGDTFFSRHPGLAEQISQHLFNAFVIYSFNRDSVTVAYASPLYYELTGSSPDDIIGKSHLLAFNQNSALSDRYMDFLNHIRNRKPVEHELQLFTKEQKPFWVMAKSQPLSSTGQTQDLHLVVLDDCTLLKKKETELNNARLSEMESAKVKERFLAKMSHELRTPINAVLGMAQLLEDTGLDKKQAELVEELRLSSENLLAMVNDILEFNMIESGGLQQNYRSFNIRKQLQLLVDKLSVRAKKKGLSMDLVISEKVPEKVGGDPVRLSLIIFNLIASAIKYTGHGGVRIFVLSEELVEGKTHIEITVKDTGIGIPSDLIDDVIKNYSRKPGFTRYIDGSPALWLSDANELARYMGGNLNVESVEGNGSKFTLNLPFDRVDEPDQKIKEETGQIMETDKKTLAGKRILVIDDYMVNRRIVKGMLEKEGCLVDQAEDGETGLKMIRDGEYDLVFMDVGMHGMNGNDVTRKLREDEIQSGTHLPVVAITASVLEKDIIACIDAGMDDFIGKPFNKSDLIAAVSADYGSGNTFIKERTNGSESALKLDGKTESEDEINLSTLSEMAGGNRMIMDEMIELFRSQTPKMLQKADDEINREDFLAAGQTVHMLKPTFIYMGLERAFKLSAEIEDITTGLDPDEKIDSQLLGKKFAELKELAEKFLK